MDICANVITVYQRQAQFRYERRTQGVFTEGEVWSVECGVLPEYPIFRNWDKKQLKNR